MSRTERTELLIGEAGIEKLARSSVLVFGVGGVGGFVIEALVRAGVGGIDIVDGDTVSESNINRQIIATCETIGRLKAEVMKERIASINPECRIKAHNCFYLPEDEKTVGRFRFADYDYVVDAVDTVAAKIDIIERSCRDGIPVISSMGTGNKLDPFGFEIAPIEETSVCPLARAVRRELRRRGITGVKVLYSKEEPVKTGSSVPGSISFVPSAAGLMIAGQVVHDLLEMEKQRR